MLKLSAPKHLSLTVTVGIGVPAFLLQVIPGFDLRHFAFPLAMAGVALPA
jgi:hypothetical protein